MGGHGSIIAVLESSNAKMWHFSTTENSNFDFEPQPVHRADMSTEDFLQLPHLEAYPVHVSLFKDVKNAVYLRQQLLDANAEFEYAFLDATTVQPLPSTSYILRRCI
jgi:hypothetical protein